MRLIIVRYVFLFVFSIVVLPLADRISYKEIAIFRILNLVLCDRGFVLTIFPYFRCKEKCIVLDFSQFF